MDEVELIAIALKYLKELGYTINDNCNIVVKGNNVNIKQVNKSIYEDEYNNLNNKININDIDFLIENNLVTIMDNSNSYLFNNYKDFYMNEKSKLYEKIINKKIVFHLLDNRVIKSSDCNITNLFNGYTINETSSNDLEVLDVFEDYKLTDGYPKANKGKLKIKE